MRRTVVNSFVKILLVAVLSWGSIYTTHAQKVVCPNFQAGHDSLNKLITKHLPVDSAKTLYFQFGWAANNLRLYSNVIVDFEDIMPYTFYKEVEKGFVYVSTEKLQYFYMQYEYGSGVSTCWIRNTALENPPERKRKEVEKKKLFEISPDHFLFLRDSNSKNEGSGHVGESEKKFVTGSSEKSIEIIKEEEVAYEEMVEEAPIRHVEQLENRVYNLGEIDKNAEFDGGMDALNKFIADNIQYPEKAKHDRIGGTVYVQISITKEGYLGDVRVASTWLGYGLEQEAIRVIKLTNGMWTAAKLKDQSVAVTMQIPVKFKWPY